MSSRILSALSVFALCSGVFGASVDVSVKSAGNSTINVEPGTLVTYQVTAVLSDNLNEGLGAILFDLTFDGGALTPADEPTANPMLNFDRPEGMTNPAGFGGTVVGGVLVQVGGAQNTIKNTIVNAPFPIGSVIPDVGQTPVEVVTGSLTAPMADGTYTLSVSIVIASAIQQGENGSGAFWATEAVSAGTLSNLTIVVAGIPVIDMDAAGSRYLSISPPGGSTPTAFLVTGDAGNFAVSCLSAYVQADGTLAATPVFQAPATWGVAVYVGDSEILPLTQYFVQADTGSPGSPILSSPVGATTWKWGDVNNSNVVNLDDILCELAGFGGNFSMCTLYGDDQMGFVPNRIVNLDDILAVLSAFGGTPYGGTPPCP